MMTDVSSDARNHPDRGRLGCRNSARSRVKSFRRRSIPVPDAREHLPPESMVIHPSDKSTENARGDRRHPACGYVDNSAEADYPHPHRLNKEAKIDQILHLDNAER